MGADIEKIIKNDSLLPGSLAVGAICGGGVQAVWEAEGIITAFGGMVVLKDP